MGIAVSGRVQPVTGHLLAIAGRGKKPIYESLVRIRLSVGDEAVDIGNRRRQPGEIERHAPEQRKRAGFRRGLQPLRLEFGENEPVDRVAWPAGVLYGRKRRPFRPLQRPVDLPRGDLLDPLREHFHLLRLERFAALRRRHPFAAIRGGDPR